MRRLSLLGLVFFILSVLAVPAMAAEDGNTKMLQGVITGAFDQWAEKQADGLIMDSKIVANNSSGEARVGVFDSVTEPITIVEDGRFEKMSSETLPLFIVLAKILVVVVALLCLVQIMAPGWAAGFTEFINGRATYYEPKEILKTGRDLCLWFLCGPGLLMGMFWACNVWVSRMDTSVLDQVVISSDNLSSYLTLGAAAKGLKYYMSIRGSILLISSKYWWFLGLILAWKKTRWAGVLFLEYVAVQVFVQPFLVSTLTDTVGYTLEGGFGSFLADIIVYGGLTILMLLICFIAFTSPIWIKIFSPNTWRTLIQTARGL